jgi:cytochrome c-type biogenesis protein CcmE
MEQGRTVASDGTRERRNGGAGKPRRFKRNDFKDSKGMEKKVILFAAKPQDFELSEQIVVTGQMKGEVFYASDLLMKCPSKYKDEEIYIKSEKRS